MRKFVINEEEGVNVSAVRQRILDILSDPTLSAADKASLIGAIKPGSTNSGHSNDMSNSIDNNPFSENGKESSTDKSGNEGGHRNKNDKYGDGYDDSNKKPDNDNKSNGQSDKNTTAKQKAQSAAQQAQSAANAAQQAANRAQQSANAAQQKANDTGSTSDQSAAQQAQSAASQAQSAANQAKSQAQQAQQSASQATQQSDSGDETGAQQSASQAQSAANAAQQSAKQAQQAAGQASKAAGETSQSGQSGKSGQSGSNEESAVNNAQNKLDSSNSAQESANAAQQAASAAQNAANQAQQAANQAQQTASSTRSSQAQSAANAAQQAANQAQQSANQAQNAANQAQQAANSNDAQQAKSAAQNAIDSANDAINSANDAMQNAGQSGSKSQNQDNSSNGESGQSENSDSAEDDKFKPRDKHKKTQSSQSNSQSSKTPSQEFADGWNQAMADYDDTKVIPDYHEPESTEYDYGYNSAIDAMEDSLSGKRQQQQQQQSQNQGPKLTPPPTNPEEDLKNGIAFGKMYADLMFKNDGKKIYLPDKFNFDLPDIPDMELITTADMRESAGDDLTDIITIINNTGMDDDAKSVELEKLIAKLHIEGKDDGDTKETDKDPKIGYAPGLESPDYDWAHQQDIITREQGDLIRKRNGIKEKKSKIFKNHANPESEAAVKLRQRVDALEKVWAAGDRDWKKTGDKFKESALERIAQNNTYVIPWNQALQEFIHGAFSGYAKEGYHKQRLVINHIGKHRKEARYDDIERLTLYIDTSDSIYGILSYITAEISGIAQSVNCHNIDIHLFCDEVYEDKWDLDPEELSEEGWGLSGVSTGGTHLQAVYDNISENYVEYDRDPGVVIIISDSDLLDNGNGFGDYMKNKEIDNRYKEDLFEMLEGNTFYALYISNYSNMAEFEKKLNKNMVPGSKFAFITPDMITTAEAENESMKTISKKRTTTLYEANNLRKSRTDKVQDMAKQNVETEEERRARLAKMRLDIARQGGYLEQYDDANAIIKWMTANFPYYKMVNDNDALKDEHDAMPNKYKINNDLSVDVYSRLGLTFNDNKVRAHDKSIVSVRPDRIPAGIVFNKLFGQLHLQNSNTVSIPTNFFKDIINNSIIIDNCDYLENIENLPVIKGEGEVSIFGCSKLDREQLDKYETKSGKETITDIFEMETPVNNKIQKLIESRIALGRAFLNESTGMNEAFGSNILNNLYYKNRDRMPEITSKLNIAWSEIDDGLVEYYKSYGEVKDLINHTKDVNRQKGMYGVMMFTDANDRINYVSAGKSAEHDTTWVNPDILDILKERTQQVIKLKNDFKSLKVDYSNFLRGSYSETDRANTVTLQKFMLNLGYIYLSWLYATGVNEQGRSVPVKMQADEIWTNGNAFGIDTANLSRLTAHERFARALGIDYRGCSWNFSPYDRDKFFAACRNARIENMFNPDLVRTVLQAINIRTDAQNAQVYTFDEIQNGDIYGIFNELRPIDVRDSLIFNLSVKEDKLPVSNKISEFLQLEMVPDYVSRLYYISIKDTHHKIEDVIDTPENRKANFNVTSQRKFIETIRQKNKERRAGLLANKTVGSDKRIADDIIGTTTTNEVEFDVRPFMTPEEVEQWEQDYDNGTAGKRYATREEWEQNKVKDILERRKKVLTREIDSIPVKEQDLVKSILKNRQYDLEKSSNPETRAKLDKVRTTLRDWDKITTDWDNARAEWSYVLDRDEIKDKVAASKEELDRITEDLDKWDDILKDWENYREQWKDRLIRSDKVKANATTSKYPEIAAGNKSIVKGNDFTPIIGEDGNSGSLQKMISAAKKAVDKLPATAFDGDYYIQKVTKTNGESDVAVVNGLLDRAEAFIKEIIKQYKNVYNEIRAVPIKFDKDNILDFKYSYSNYAQERDFRKYAEENGITITGYFKDTPGFNKWLVDRVFKEKENKYNQIVKCLETAFDITPYYKDLSLEIRKIIKAAATTDPAEQWKLTTDAIDKIYEICERIYGTFKRKDAKGETNAKKALDNAIKMIKAVNSKNTDLYIS